VKVDPAALSADAAYFWQVATIAPRPIAWTSTLNEDGSANLAPFSFFTGVSSDPPTCLICVARRRKEPDGQRPPKDTWRNIERTGEFVVHVVNELFASGAEAIAVNGHRVAGTTSFRCVGTTILVNDVKIASPIVVRQKDDLEQAHLGPDQSRRPIDHGGTFGRPSFVVG